MKVLHLLVIVASVLFVASPRIYCQTSTGYSVTEYYFGTTCSGTPYTTTYAKVSNISPCSPIACSSVTVNGVSRSNRGLCVSSAANATAGNLWTATYASTDTTCSQEPTSVTTYQLNQCLPGLLGSTKYTCDTQTFYPGVFTCDAPITQVTPVTTTTCSNGKSTVCKTSSTSGLKAGFIGITMVVIAFMLC